MDIDRRNGIKRALLGAGAGAVALAGINKVAAETIVTDEYVSVDGKRFTNAVTAVVGKSGNVDYHTSDYSSDGACIAAALDYVSGLGGGCVILREGEYNAAIDWTYDNVVLKGNGVSSILKTTGDNTITVSSAGKVVRLQDLAIENTSNGSEIGIGIYQTADVTAHYYIERVQFTTKLNAFYINNDPAAGEELGNIHVVDCRFINCSSNTDGLEYVNGTYHVVSVQGSQTEDHEMTFIGNYLVHTGTRANAIGIYAIGNSTSGDGQGATAIEGGVFSDNQFIDVKREGLYISDTRHMNIHNNRMYGTGVAGEARIGFCFLRGYRNIISNNYCENFEERAYRIDHNTECIWTGNAAYNVGIYQGHVPSAAGMTVKGSQKCIVTNNIIETSALQTTTNSILILIGDHDGSTPRNSTGNIISGNKLSGGTTKITFDDDNQYDNTIVQPENFKVWYPDDTIIRAQKLQREISKGVPINNLRMWLPGAENSGNYINDFSKTGGIGAITGTLIRSTGRYNNKVSNAGSSSNYITMSNMPAVGTIAGSLHVVISISALSAGVASYISRCNYSSGRWYEWTFNDNTNVRIRWHNGTSYADMVFSYVFPLNTEIALTVTLEDDGAGGVDGILYADGVQVATQNISGNQPSLTSEIVNIYGAAGSNVPTADYESFMVFDVTLSPQQVWELVNRPIEISDIQAYQHKTVTPTIYSGTAAPSIVPTKPGDTYIDTAAGDVYTSVGTSSSADWVKTN